MNLVTVFLGRGDGTFRAAEEVDATRGAPRPYGLAVGDVDGDGKPDLVFGGPLGDVLVLLSQVH